ncbi:MAG: hypothetical protein WBZ42_03600 [Halobacteriota archaeon]
MVRCVEFYQKWRRDPEWRECARSDASRSEIEKYLDFIDELEEKHDIKRDFAIANLTEGAARPIPRPIEEGKGLLLKPPVSWFGTITTHEEAVEFRTNVVAAIVEELRRDEPDLTAERVKGIVNAEEKRVEETYTTIRAKKYEEKLRKEEAKAVKYPPVSCADLEATRRAEVEKREAERREWAEKEVERGRAAEVERQAKLKKIFVEVDGRKYQVVLDDSGTIEGSDRLEFYDDKTGRFCGAHDNVIPSWEPRISTEAEIAIEIKKGFLFGAIIDAVNAKEEGAKEILDEASALRQPLVDAQDLKLNEKELPIYARAVKKLECQRVTNDIRELRRIRDKYAPDVTTIAELDEKMEDARDACEAKGIFISG